MTEQRSDKQAEQAVLSAAFYSRTAREEACRHVTGRDFDDPRHEAIWEAMRSLDRHGKSVDQTTIIAALGGNRGAIEMLPEVATAVAVPDAVADYAAIVRGWSVRRHIETTARDVIAKATTHGNAATFASETAARFAAIRDSGDDNDVAAVTLEELLAEEDDEPDWLVPGLLERRDRLMLTGNEGGGKSHALRQIAVFAAAGRHPFTQARIEPTRVAIVDCENTRGQVKRKLRPVARHLAQTGHRTEGRLMLECTSRLDITRDRDLAQVHQFVDSLQPDLVVIGPLYRLVPRALQTDDEAAPVLAALDSLRDRGCALLIEAHAGHTIGKGGERDLRPRGSSALLGWPEFGYGMRAISEGYADLVPWRGNREERNWPQRLRAVDGCRWEPVDTVTPLPDLSAGGF